MPEATQGLPRTFSLCLRSCDAEETRSQGEPDVWLNISPEPFADCQQWMKRIKTKQNFWLAHKADDTKI